MTQQTFFGERVELPFDSSDLLIESAEFDRQVIFTRASDTVLFGFAEFTFPGIEGKAIWAPASEDQQMSFVLPAGQELWAGHSVDGQQVTLSWLVTKAPVTTS